MTRPCIIVAGMGRCGTSLMMQMLYAAGVPCEGPWPAFETDAVLPGIFDAAAFDERQDHAIKMIDPMHLGPGALPHHVVIWMDRAHTEQAKSQIKFLRSAGGDVEATRPARRAMEATLRHDRPLNRAALGIPGRTPAMAVPFEILLEDPAWVAQGVASFLAPHGWTGLDVEAMALVVRPRSPACYPGFLETSLLRAPAPKPLMEA
jgi:hypothetical protein